MQSQTPRPGRLRATRNATPSPAAMLTLLSVLAGQALLSTACLQEDPEVMGAFDGSGTALRLQEVEDQAGELLERDRVSVEGEVSEVCPTAGCWLVLREGSRSLRVELLGFSVRNARRALKRRTSSPLPASLLSKSIAI